MQSVARPFQTGALLVETRVNEEIKKSILAIYAENGFQSDTRFSCVAGGNGTTPQHHQGMGRRHLARNRAPWVWAFRLELCQGLGGRP